MRRVLNLGLVPPPVRLGENRQAHDDAEKKLSQARMGHRNRGRKKRTVIPPRTACATTARTAKPPNRRTQRRESLRQSHNARIIVRIATVPAIMRWPCSYITPPTMRGMRKLPNEVGQSGTESPASFEVTSAPAMTSKKVAKVTRMA